MFAASIDQLPFASPHIGHADSPTARAWIWSAACSLSADGISCDSFSPRAGRRRRAGGAAGSTSAACRHWGAGRGTSLAPFLLCLSFFLLFFPTWPPGSPAPVPRQPRSRTGRLFYMAIRLCSGAAHASQPRPAGPRPPRAALAPPPALGRRPLCTLAALRPRLLPLAQQLTLCAVAGLIPARHAGPVSAIASASDSSEAMFAGPRHSPPPTRPGTASGRPRSSLGQKTIFLSTF